MSEEIMSHHNRQNLESFTFNSEGKPDFLGELHSKKTCYLSALNVNLDDLVKLKLSRMAYTWKNV